MTVLVISVNLTQKRDTWAKETSTEKMTLVNHLCSIPGLIIDVEGSPTLHRQSHPWVYGPGVYERVNWGTGEVAHYLKTLATLPEVMGSIPSSHVSYHNYL